MSTRGRTYLLPVALMCVCAALALVLGLGLGSGSGDGDQASQASVSADGIGGSASGAEDEGASGQDDGSGDDPDAGASDSASASGGSSGGDEEDGASGGADATDADVTVENVTEFVDDDAAAVLSSGEASSYHSDSPLVEEATEVLEAYEEQGDCIVAKAGYLDFLGGTWGCVLQGSDWVDICVVSEDDDGEGCVVYVWHLDAAAAAEALL